MNRKKENTHNVDDNTLITNPHAANQQDIVAELNSSTHGLSHSEAAARLEQVGHNALPQAKSKSVFSIFVQQFVSPLIYVLLAAALLSIVIEEWLDAIFIFAVLMINATIGTIQEHSAAKAASALSQLVTTRTRVLRDGDAYEIDSRELIPGDIVLLESGDKIPADIRLLTSHDLEIDESLLTGESTAVLKSPEQICDIDTILADRRNMAFASTFVIRGRGQGIVTNTALSTEVGRIAADVIGGGTVKAPLIIRMESFTQRIAIIIGLASILMAIIAFSRGMPMTEIFLLAVALAVSTIPEGLPVALTVALAVGMNRMAKRNVIVRRLIAMEALGSCTFIATDKTGTLTVNQLTARRIAFPEQDVWPITGEGINPEGNILSEDPLSNIQSNKLDRLCLACILPNEGFLGHLNNQWTAHGDAVDIALLVMAHKAGFTRPEMTQSYPEISNIPFESEILFSASLNIIDDKQYAFVKGALERLLPMCSHMTGETSDVTIDHEVLHQQLNHLAERGYRVLAVASGEITLQTNETFSEEHLQDLTLLGLIGMIDPMRVEAKAAINACRDAGIEVAMITGDHPVTSFAIAKELNLASESKQIVTGQQLKLAKSENEIDALTQHARVFARVEPHQKLDIVHSLQRNGHFVAVSGDGANDAPALRAAHVGVAMGKDGTDLARETADLVITDDNFSSIVSGIEQGRVAYANVRKVIFLLISTGAAELVLFSLALFMGMPLPLLAVQLLWLNLVTNGIQDIALAFEPSEGDELKKPPRSPKEPIFNRLMVERVVISALTMGITAFLVFQWLLNSGFSLDEARNGTLLLVVLFENVHVFNCRSETTSIFKQKFFRNRILLMGTLAAQLIHIGAMYTPGLNTVLNIQPISFEHWLELFALAFTVLIAMEIHKWLRNK